MIEAETGPERLWHQLEEYQRILRVVVDAEAVAHLEELIEETTKRLRDMRRRFH
jgi:hypothetical protein